MAMDQKDKVTETWKQAISVDDSFRQMLPMLYEFYLKHGDLQKATELVVEDKDPLRRGLYSGLIDYQTGDKESAERQWNRVVRREVDEETEGFEFWMECGLRLGQVQRVIEKSVPILADGATTLEPVVLFGIAVAMTGDIPRSDSFFQAVRDNIAWRKGAKLSRKHWEKLSSLVQDEAVRAALRHHFESGEEKRPEEQESAEAAAILTATDQSEAGS